MPPRRRAAAGAPCASALASPGRQRRRALLADTVGRRRSRFGDRATAAAFWDRPWGHLGSLGYRGPDGRGLRHSGRPRGHYPRRRDGARPHRLRARAARPGCVRIPNGFSGGDMGQFRQLDLADHRLLHDPCCVTSRGLGAHTLHTPWQAKARQTIGLGFCPMVRP